MQSRGHAKAEDMQSRGYAKQRVCYLLLVCAADAKQEARLQGQQLYTLCFAMT